jgi:formylglycine-generating enzyme required for sulfatase activity
VDDGNEFSASVGSYPDSTSLYGVLDMAGNEWEWLADWYAVDYYQRSPEDNPQGPAPGETRVLRGGAWSSGQWLVRTAYRGYSDPNIAYNGHGIRCAQSP